MMCRATLLGLAMLVSSVGYGQYRETWRCAKGDQLIYYRISFKDVKGEPPCKVYEKYAGQKTRRIGFSEKSKNICEPSLKRILKRCRSQGMHCDQIN